MKFGQEDDSVSNMFASKHEDQLNPKSPQKYLFKLSMVVSPRAEEMDIVGTLSPDSWLPLPTQ